VMLRLPPPLLFSQAFVPGAFLPVFVDKLWWSIEVEGVVLVVWIYSLGREGTTPGLKTSLSSVRKEG